MIRYFLQLPWPIEVFSLASITLIIRIFIIDLVTPPKLPMGSPNTFNMNNPVGSGGAVGGSASAGGSGAAENSRITPLSDREIAYIKENVLDNTQAMSSINGRLRKHMDKLEQLHGDENSDVTQLTKQYNLVKKNFEQFKAKQEERNTIFSDLYVRQGGSIQGLGDRAQQYLESTHDTIARATQLIDKYKDE